MIDGKNTPKRKTDQMIDNLPDDACVIVLMFKDDGMKAYGLRGDGPFFLTQGGGISTDVNRARRFAHAAHANAKAKDMQNYAFVYGGLAMRLSQVKKHQVS